jgi:hypothetical protein
MFMDSWWRRLCFETVHGKGKSREARISSREQKGNAESYGTLEVGRWEKEEKREPGKERMM